MVILKGPLNCIERKKHVCFVINVGYKEVVVECSNPLLNMKYHNLVLKTVKNDIFTYLH